MRFTTTCAVLLILISGGNAGEIALRSPDGRLSASLKVGKTLSLNLLDSSTLILKLDSISLAVRGNKPFGLDPGMPRTARRSQDTLISPQIREKQAVLPERYNEVSVRFPGGFGLVVRAYNDGIAYRFVTSLHGDIVVEREAFALSLPDSARITYQFTKEFWSAYEYPYQTSLVREVPADGQCSLPVLAELPKGRRVLITEAQIQDYPGLWLRNPGGNSLRATFAGYPLALLDDGEIYSRGKVTKHADEIARTSGTREYPWRLFAVARRDADLLTNSLVYLLGEPSRLTDVSWVSPGVVTLDWWARRNIFGVDFIAGANTATAKYLIDFAARYRLGYVLLDSGWSRDDDLLATNPEMNIEEIVAYAKGKGVRLLLWAVWSTLERQWDAAFERFSRWGISGIKIDFMNRDDQEMVRYYYRVAEETARRKMLVIFHGAYKPDGLRRTYPNVITREGLIEFEQSQGTMTDSPEYHATLPFIRMVTGPADYLPGTVNNAQPEEFRMVTQRPMGRGTRAHSMALCVVIESPMRMLPDSPPDYYREDACTKIMAEIPVQWDEIRVLHARIGDYVAVARRHGDEWFVGAITDQDPRDLQIDCSFLSLGKSYSLTAVGDGMNADRRGIDHRITTTTVTREDHFTIHLAPAGGWVARFVPDRR